jgi:hypothetical protein
MLDQTSSTTIRTNHQYRPSNKTIKAMEKLALIKDSTIHKEMYKI